MVCTIIIKHSKFKRKSQPLSPFLWHRYVSWKHLCDLCGLELTLGNNLVTFLHFKACFYYYVLHTCDDVETNIWTKDLKALWDWRFSHFAFLLCPHQLLYFYFTIAHQIQWRIRIDKSLYATVSCMAVCMHVSMPEKISGSSPKSNRLTVHENLLVLNLPFLTYPSRLTELKLFGKLRSIR